MTKKNTAFTRLHHAFTSHPRAAGESYWQHLAFTLSMTGRLVLCALALLVHGIFPFLLTHAASNRMKRCQNVLEDRACRTRQSPDAG